MRFSFLKNVAIMNGGGKITRLWEEDIDRDLQVTQDDIVWTLWKILDKSHRIKVNQMKDFQLLINILRNIGVNHKIVYIYIY